MMKNFHITQFILIEDLNMDFTDGLTVMTGETGTGKSILLDALALILGSPGEVDLIRRGADETVITADFVAGRTHPVWKYLSQYDIEVGEAFNIKRTLARDGRNEALLNGRKIELQVLQEATSQLVEIHGQFANQNMLNPIKQMEMLDLIGNYKDLLKSVYDAWFEMKRIEKELEDERTFMARTAGERDFLVKAVAELRNLKSTPGEYESLDAENKEHIRIKAVAEMLQSVQSQLVAGTGAERLLVGANRILDRQKNLDLDLLEKLGTHLANSLQECRNSTEELMVLMPKYELDAERVHFVEERLKKFQSIAEKHKADATTLPELYIALDARLKRILKAADLIKKLEDELLEAKGRYSRQAQALSFARKAAAKDLSESVTKEMPPLKLEKAMFRVDVIDLTSSQWGPLGMNEVIFMARTNPGMPFTSIAKTASGGELARMILALKVIVQRVQSISSLVFDEIDTGIGGPSAAAVGERLARLAGRAQVLVVTHSPQVAARGDHHFNVTKISTDETTHTYVHKLNPQQRIEELARMLAGDEITPEALAAAQSLIREANRAAETRKKDQADKVVEYISA